MPEQNLLESAPMARIATAVVCGLTLLGLATSARAGSGDLRVEILQPTPKQLLAERDGSVEVLGGASVCGGVKYLDVFLVLDTSLSLKRSDRQDHRSRGAITLVASFPARSDIQIGVVDFDTKAQLASPLSKDRAAVIEALRKLDRHGKTDISVGIDLALARFARSAREDSTRVMLLFTDGKSNEKNARRAAQEAASRGVAIHTLLLGDSEKGIAILSEVAEITGGSFIRVTDPSELPDAFLNLRTTGVEEVTLRVNGSAPLPAELIGGTFSGRVPLVPGSNRIVATATSLDGETREDEVTVFVSGPLRVAINRPVDGTLYEELESELHVEGSASIFADLPASPLGAHDDGHVQDPDPWIQSVVLSVNGSPPFATTVRAGRFDGRVLLREGENRIVARATSADGRTAEDAITVTVRPPGCSALDVRAEIDGRPALSISDRAVEIVFDASNSMWGQINGTAKIEIAKQSLAATLDALPSDLLVGLRVYGHQHVYQRKDCQDSELLVPLSPLDRERIKAAISQFKPRGQTPLAYSLEQVAGDFGDFAGERAVVLLTDGVESCNGDPARAARELQSAGDAPVHVIGFGLGGDDSADLASLKAIASASGGRYLTAQSAAELRDALIATVGTPYSVWSDGAMIARAALGAGPLLLPPGDYVVQLASTPPRTLPVTVSREEAATLVLSREGRAVSYEVRRTPADYAPCGRRSSPHRAAAPDRG